jgi:hypothetical protein
MEIYQKKSLHSRGEKSRKDTYGTKTKVVRWRKDICRNVERHVTKDGRSALSEKYS